MTLWPFKLQQLKRSPMKSLQILLARIATLLLLFLIADSHASINNSQNIKSTHYQASLKPNRRINLHRAIERYTREYNLPSEELFAALLIVESSLNPCAISRVGAAGLSQLMPKTARNIGVTDRFDIHQSLWGGASVLRSALNLTNGDITKSLGLYNWGSKSLKTPFQSWPSETKNYVSKISKRQKQFRSSHWKKYVPKYIAYKNGKICNAEQTISLR